VKPIYFNHHYPFDPTLESNVDFPLIPSEGDWVSSYRRTSPRIGEDGTPSIISTASIPPSTSGSTDDVSAKARTAPP